MCIYAYIVSKTDKKEAIFKQRRSKMAKKTGRKFETLPTETQTRMRDYVFHNLLVPSETLAWELSLSSTTVAALKANITRKLQK
jgi:hypothetical protein